MLREELTIMKFYSEVTKRLYNTEKELVEAETKIKNAEAEKIAAEKAKKEARATRAKEVEKALKEASEAQSKAIKMLKDFTNDYGYFHMSYSTKEEEDASASVNTFFNDLMSSFLQ